MSREPATTMSTSPPRVFQAGDWSLPSPSGYDLIICNPPFWDSSLVKGAAPGKQKLAGQRARAPPCEPPMCAADGGVWS